jgi:hypothetical protein
VLFCLLYINQLPVSVDRTQNVLYIIQRQSGTSIGALFVCYISINCLYQGIVPKMYCISSNADRSDLTCFFVCYISINCMYQWIVPKMYYISSNADRQHRSERLDVLFCLLYINQLPVVEWSVPKNLLYIIQRRSERLDVLFCLLYQSTACSGSSPKFIMYHPTPIGVTHAFCLLYQ